jgi:hypothetical protein
MYQRSKNKLVQQSKNEENVQVVTTTAYLVTCVKCLTFVPGLPQRSR